MSLDHPEVILGDSGAYSKPGDEKLYVKFYTRAVQDGVATNEEGRPVFKDVPYVRIHIPGDKNNVIDTKATDEHKRRFPKQWMHYKNAEEGAEKIEGTLLTEWPRITRSQAEELKYMHVYTVEQLATLPDQFGSKIMGFFDIRLKAKKYLEQAKDEAFAERMAVENDALKARIAALEAMMAPKVETKGSKREPARSGAGGE